MKNHWGEIIFIIISIFYRVFWDVQKYDKEKHPPKKPLIGSSPADSLKPSAPGPQLKNVHEEPGQLASGNTLRFSTAPKQPILASIRPKLLSTSKPTCPLKVPPSIDRVLNRYSGWKKAIVMSELIHPRIYPE